MSHKYNANDKTREGVATFDRVEIIQHDYTPAILFETESNKLCEIKMDDSENKFSISLFDNDDDNSLNLFELSYKTASSGQISAITGLDLTLSGINDNDDRTNFTIQVGKDKDNDKENKKITSYNTETKIATIDSAFENAIQVNDPYILFKATLKVNGFIESTALVSNTNTTIADSLIVLGKGNDGTSKDLGLIFETNPFNLFLQLNSFLL